MIRPAKRPRRVRGLVALLAAGAAVMISCGQNQSDKPVADALAENQLTPVAEPTAAPPGHPPVGGAVSAAPLREGVVDLRGVTAVPPESWRQVPPSSSMRAAEFELPGAAGAANLAIFAGNWGSVDDNVARWVGQFSGPDGAPASGVQRRSLVVGEGQPGGGLQVVRVAVSGTYIGDMGGGTANPGYRMLGAIVQTSSGFHYLKVVGPEATVFEWEDEFDAFVASLRRS